MVLGNWKGNSDGLVAVHVFHSTRLINGPYVASWCFYNLWYSRKTCIDLCNRT